MEFWKHSELKWFSFGFVRLDDTLLISRNDWYRGQALVVLGRTQKYTVYVVTNGMKLTRLSTIIRPMLDLGVDHGEGGVDFHWCGL